MDKGQGFTVTSQPDNGYYVDSQHPMTTQVLTNQENVQPYPPGYTFTARGYSINSGDYVRTANQGNATNTPWDTEMPTTRDDVAILDIDTAPPTDWLGLAIFVTLCCCLPLGIVAIIFSVESRSAVSVNDMSRARMKASKARVYSLVGLGLGLALSILMGVMYAVVIKNSY